MVSAASRHFFSSGLNRLYARCNFILEIAAESGKRTGYRLGILHPLHWLLADVPSRLRQGCHCTDVV